MESKHKQSTFSRTKKLVIAAIMAALSSSLLILASYLPTARVGLAAVSGIPIIISVILCGMLYGFLSYTTAFLTAILMSGSYAIPLLFAVLLGSYPLIKAFAEKVKSKPLRVALKFLFFNAAATVIIAGTLLFFAEYAAQLQSALNIAIYYVAGNVVFLIYDIALTQLITILYKRIIWKIVK